MAGTKLEAKLQRANNGTPWGFRMQGGKDFGSPLMISRVTPGSLADQCGIASGDFILQVGGVDTTGLLHQEAQAQVKQHVTTLPLTLQRGGTVKGFCDPAQVKSLAESASPPLPPPPAAQPPSPSAASLPPQTAAPPPPSSVGGAGYAAPNLDRLSSKTANLSLENTTPRGFGTSHTEHPSRSFQALKGTADKGQEPSVVENPPWRRPSQGQREALTEDGVKAWRPSETYKLIHGQDVGPSKAVAQYDPAAREASPAASPPPASLPSPPASLPSPPASLPPPLASLPSPPASLSPPPASLPSPPASLAPPPASLPSPPAPLAPAAPAPTASVPASMSQAPANPRAPRFVLPSHNNTFTQLSSGPAPAMRRTTPAAPRFSSSPGKAYGPRSGGPAKPATSGAAGLRNVMMNQASSSPRIPVCAGCHQPIRGPFVSAMNETWCPEHFVCANCGEQLTDQGFVEQDGKLYCERDYTNLYAPQCNRCNKPVVGEGVSAMGKSWHQHCFVCTHCSQPLGAGTFRVEEGKTYCEKDWVAMFQNMCVGCNFPIEPGDRFVEALENWFHTECFNCSTCQANLEGQGFVARNGKPYCTKHGR